MLTAREATDPDGGAIASRTLYGCRFFGIENVSSTYMQRIVFHTLPKKATWNWILQTAVALLDPASSAQFVNVSDNYCIPTTVTT